MKKYTVILHPDAECSGGFVSLKARKFLTKAKKMRAKFDVYCSRTSLLWRMRDVNASLQIKTESMFDLQNRDHVMRRALRVMFGFQLPGIRRLLPSFVEDHVKHGSEHVKLPLKLPCSDAIELCTAARMLDRSAVATREFPRSFLRKSGAAPSRSVLL